MTRANALEADVRLYYVRDGKRQQLASSVTAFDELTAARLE